MHQVGTTSLLIYFIIATSGHLWGIINGCVLTDILYSYIYIYIYIYDKHIGMTNIKKKLKVQVKLPQKIEYTAVLISP